MTSAGGSSGAGASARLHAKGGGADGRLELAIAAVTPQLIAEDARGGRAGRRLWRLTYELAELPGGATQVHIAVELRECSPLDRLAWRLMRTHLERQYGQGLLRLKGVLGGLGIRRRRCRQGGTSKGELVLGTSGPDTCRGGGGADDVEGAAGSDRLYGDARDDRLFGRFGDDRIVGGDGDDVLQGGRGRDLMYGGAGNDEITGGFDADRMHGGPGNDVLIARGGGGDAVDCGLGRDIVIRESRDRVSATCEVVRRR